MSEGAQVAAVIAAVLASLAVGCFAGCDIGKAQHATALCKDAGYLSGVSKDNLIVCTTKASVTEPLQLMKPDEAAK